MVCTLAMDAVASSCEACAGMLSTHARETERASWTRKEGINVKRADIRNVLKQR